MLPPKVYVDANIFKFSATALPRLKPRLQTLNWGGIELEETVHDFVVENPNEKIENPELRAEADLLPELARFGTNRKVRYVVQVEAEFEAWGLPNMDSDSGRFYGAPVELVDAPITYGRVMVGGIENPRESQRGFLEGIQDKRFKELQKMTGAYQGENRPNGNQLLDAFHLWCAEHNGCDYFLTMDFSLIKVILSNRKRKLGVNLVRPSELLSEVQKLS